MTLTPGFGGVTAADRVTLALLLQRMRSHLVASVVLLAVPLAPTVRAQIDCAAASTQTDIDRCACEAFLAAADEQAHAVRDLETRLSPAQQKALRAAQAA